MKKGKTSAEKWKIFQTFVKQYSVKFVNFIDISSFFPKSIHIQNKKVKLNPNLVDEVMFQYCYPRLDIEVTKGLNHLLKSPFCIHPKTGNRHK
jgi:DNA primase catalytic subunit